MAGALFPGLRAESGFGGWDEVAAKVERMLVQKAKVIAAHRQTSVGQVLSEALRPAIDEGYRQVVNQAAQDCRSASTV